MAKPSIPQTLADGEKIRNTWGANPTFKLGDVTLANFTSAYDDVAAQDRIVETKRTELQGLIDLRDEAATQLQDLNTRALSGFRAVYGPDSVQYDQAGGTRRSERASPRRTAKTAA